MIFLILIFAIFTALISASLVIPRAGGPSFVPIPPSCNVTNPLPCTANTTRISGYMPSSNFTSNHQLYSFYLLASQLNSTAQFQGCLQQCNGFGTPGTCKAALLAYDVPTPADFFGTQGGVLEIACFMYSKFLSRGDFVKAPNGTYVDERAGNIRC
ncbi:hypothetical protein LTR66_011620 [Elasticomyces elasticus]|nr:hypothetical protein LTR66_011620 [Elasticomyces elasticus]KAK5010155.1 hypothetical protein LTR28_011520 [Elasticomyces elasticus]